MANREEDEGASRKLARRIAEAIEAGKFDLARALTEEAIRMRVTATR